MKKIKILEDCKAYVSSGVLKKFKKGKTYEVNEFIFKSFTNSARGEAFDGEVDFKNIKKDTKAKKSKEKKTPQEEIGILKKEILELNKIIEKQEGIIKEFKDKQTKNEDKKVDLNKLNKINLIKYAKENLNMDLDMELTKNKMIEKIEEVENESIE